MSTQRTGSPRVLCIVRPPALTTHATELSCDLEEIDRFTGALNDGAILPEDFAL